jgi:excisionase family DNA binding protein
VSAQPSGEKRLLSVEEAAQFLNVPVRWIRDHTGRRSPQLPSFKVGKYRRFRLDELERWLAQNRTVAA